MTQRTKITDWPEVRVNVNPQTLERIEAERERRALSRADIVREVLAKAFDSEENTGS